MYKQGINNLDEQLKLNAERDKRAVAYAAECANRPPASPAPPAQFGDGFIWSPIDAIGLQDID